MSLPIESILPALVQALSNHPCAVLQAPPGAGKTTHVPLALLDQPWLAGQTLLMLEPRRLAARAAARRMAALRGEAVGETVGYRVRLDSRVGSSTRIEVVTDGVLVRRMQQDPELRGVGAVLFDEFHERGLEGDLALTLCRDIQGALREDLRLLVMSATLDGAAIAKFLGAAPVITSEGRLFPVEVRYREAPEPTPARFSEAMAAAVRRALLDERGDILAFLPGAGEIRRTEALLAAAGLPPAIRVLPLYGDLTSEAQDQALQPAPPGQRKVVLATSLAETSLTIEGVRVVIDGGLMRVPRFDPQSGMTRLHTQRVSLASAEQRRGRAGRLAPGVCYRLWSEEEQRALRPFNSPEILEADVAPLALELALWGCRDPATLAWLDPPRAAAFAQARGLLHSLNALDAEGAITAHGRRMARFGVHPRLAHMMLIAQELGGLEALACRVAAALEARDSRRMREADLRSRLSRPGPEERKAARQWARLLGNNSRTIDSDAEALAEAENGTGRLLALAYPDRVARRRPGTVAQYQLSQGRGAVFADSAEPLATHEWLVVAALDGDRRDARIFLAAPIARTDIEELFADRLETRTHVWWDAREQAVQARRQTRLGALLLEDRPWPDPPAEAVTAALLDGIRDLGLACLPWSDATRHWQQRVLFVRNLDAGNSDAGNSDGEGGEGGGWPDVGDAALCDTLEQWLAPVLTGLSRRSHLERLDLAAALEALLSWPQRQALDALAPSHITVPTGSCIRIDYSGEVPVLAVRLQELFGLNQTPAVARGRIPLLLHLLSPAHRPVQITRDLPGFWRNSYKAVKRDLAGQYPKHYWPENPESATPTRRRKPG